MNLNQTLQIKYQILNKLLQDSMKYNKIEDLLEVLSYHFYNKTSEYRTILEGKLVYEDKNKKTKDKAITFSLNITDIFFNEINKLKKEYINLTENIDKLKNKKNLSIDEKIEIEYLKKELENFLNKYTNILFEQEYQHISKTFNLYNRNDILLQMGKLKNIGLKNQNYYLLETLIKEKIKEELHENLTNNNYYNIHKVFDMLNTNEHKLLNSLFNELFIYSTNKLFTEIEKNSKKAKKYKKFSKAFIKDLLFNKKFILKPYKTEEQILKEELKNTIIKFIQHFNINNIEIINNIFKSSLNKEIKIKFKKVSLPNKEEIEKNLSINKAGQYDLSISPHKIVSKNGIVLVNDKNGINIELTTHKFTNKNSIDISNLTISKKNIKIKMNLDILKQYMIDNIDKIIKNTYFTFKDIIGFNTSYHPILNEIQEGIRNCHLDKNKTIEYIKSLPNDIIELKIKTNEKQQIIDKIAKEFKIRKEINIDGTNIDINSVIENLPEYKIQLKLEEQKQKLLIKEQIIKEEQLIKEYEDFYKSKIKNKNIPYKVLPNGFIIEGNIEINKINEIKRLLKNYDKYYNYKDGNAYYDGKEQNEIIKNKLEEMLKNNNVSIYEIHNIYQSTKKTISEIINTYKLEQNINLE